MTKRSPDSETKRGRRRAIPGNAEFRAGSWYNRSLIEASPDPLVTISPEGRITDVNAATVRITGCSPEELIGTRFSDYFTEPEKAEKGYETVFKKGIVRDYPLEVRHRDGGTTPVLYNASVYLDDSGRVAGVFAAARDVTELRRAEAEIEQAGAYNRNLLEAAPDPLVTISPEGKITDVNAATVKITGVPRKKLIGTDFSDYFTDPVAARAGYGQAFRDGSVKDYELRIRHRNGREIPVMYNASLYRDAAGAVVGVFAAARDITERKKAEEEKSRLAAIVESSEDAIMSKALDGTILTWNAGAQKMYGYTAHEAIGRNVSMLIPAELGDDLEYILKRVGKGAPVSHFESVRTRKDGSTVAVSLAVSPIRDADGKLTGASTIARDISAQKKAEELVRRSERYNRSLIDASLDPLVTINADGTISDVNTATSAITGLPRSKLIGTDFSGYFTDPGKAKAGYEQAFREGSVRDCELMLRHRDGGGIPVLYNATVYHDESGNVAGVFAAARDITARKKAEDELRVKNTELEAAFEEITATEEELRQNYDELAKSQQELQESTVQLRLANAYNRSLLEASLDPLVTISPEGRITDVNAAVVRVTGYNREKLIGGDFSDYFTDHAKAKSGYEIVFRDGSVTDYELEVRHKDGQVTPVLYNAAVYRDGSGKVAGVFAAARDITGQKKAEDDLRVKNTELEAAFEEITATDEELRQNYDELAKSQQELQRSEALLRLANTYNRSLLEASLDPLVTITPGGTISDVNEAAVRATGVSREELIGTDFSRYFTQHDLARAGYEQAFREGKVMDYALELRHRNGQIIPVLYNAAVYRDDAGEVTGVFAAARDVTDLRKAEATLREANAGLEARVTERTTELREANLNLVSEVAERKKAEETVRKRNEELGTINQELNAINEELTATQEELRQTNDELVKNEQQLIQKNDEMAAVNEELGTAHEELQQNNEELLKAERDLRETGQYLDNLINYASAPIIVWNPQFRITRFNKAFEKLTGKAEESVIGRTLDILFPPDRREELMARIRGTVKGDQWESVEIPVMNSGGGIRIVLWNSATIFRPDGRTVMSVIAQGQDITERKAAEAELAGKNEDLSAINEELTATQEELRLNLDKLLLTERAARETSQYLENLITYANAPIIVWDPHFRITRFNRAFEKLTGRKAEDVTGQTIEILFPDNQREEQMTTILRTLGGERWEGVEIPILHISGGIRTVLWNSATLYEGDGKTVSSVIAQGQDITARKQIEADLLTKNEELTSLEEELRQNVDELAEGEKLLRENETVLKEMVAEKDILLAEIHHRVKNNLTALISLLSLEGGYEESTAGQALKKDLQNRARSMALIHETLYKTKKFAEVDMSVYLKTLIDQMQASLPSAVPIRIEIHADNVALDIPRATPTGLIVNELVTNSFKYAFPPSFDTRKVRSAAPTITIDLSKTDGMYTLTCRDNGVGLPENFDVASAKSLGLKLVNFLAKHQMRATVSHETRDGTAFTFTFREMPGLGKGDAA